MKKATRLFLSFLVGSLLLTATPARAGGRWALTAYGGQLAQEHLVEILVNDYYMESATLAALALGREFAGSPRLITWELEGQAVKHLRKQHHWEFNGLVILRWHPFPWDRHLDTSLAIGDGLSYALEEPVIEVEDETDRASRLLNYLLLELAIAVPQAPAWEIVGRIHHRSGIFGTFGDTREGSNFLSLGVKRWF